MAPQIIKGQCRAADLSKMQKPVLEQAQKKPDEIKLKASCSRPADPISQSFTKPAKGSVNLSQIVMKFSACQLSRACAYGSSAR